MSVFKCLKCKKIVKKEDVEDDFHFIFDESGVELELQKLLKECFDIEVIKKRLDRQGLCSPCVENLVDTYDLLQKNAEEDGNSNLLENANENDEEHLMYSDQEQSDEHLYVVAETDDVKIDASDDINVDNYEESGSQRDGVPDVAYTTEEMELDEHAGMNVIEVDLETGQEYTIYQEEDQIEEQQSTESEEVAIEHVYDKRKEMEEYFVDNLDEEYMDEDDPNDEEDDRKVSLLETMNEDNIDIFEYKKNIIKVDPTETNLKHSLFCVVSFILYFNNNYKQ